MTSFPKWCPATAPRVDKLPQLTALEAYDAMFLFLKNSFERGDMGADHLRWLLSAIDRDNLWSDGVPNDPAMWGDWIEAVAQVKAIDLSSEANRDIRFAPSS